MAPKVKITKENIVNAALDLVRHKGPDMINARAIATALNCSTQPIFSNFETMDELRAEVIVAANALSNEYTKRELDKKEFPPYKAYGMAYIRFAKEETELFKLLYMRDRADEKLHSDDKEIFTKEIINLVHDNTGLLEDRATLFHLEMWSFVHGIASMFATNFVDLDWKLVSNMITDVYQGLKKQYESEV